MSWNILKNSSQLFDSAWRKNKRELLTIIESFINYNNILIHHKNIPDISISLPINFPLYFNINDIESELDRFSSIYDYNKFVNNKRSLSKRLIIYNDDNTLLSGTIDYLISKNQYSSYHIFCNTHRSYNTFKYIEKKYLNKVRLNDVENDFISMLRIHINEFDEYYNDDDICNDDIVIFLNYQSNIYYLDDIFNLVHNCYISLPSNKFILLLLYLKYGQYFNIELISEKNDYMFIKISYNKKCYTLKRIINGIERWCDGQRKNIKKIIKFINDSLT